MSHTHSVVDEFSTLFTLVKTAAAIAAAKAPDNQTGSTSRTIIPKAASPTSPYNLYETIPGITTKGGMTISLMAAAASTPF